MGVRPQQHIMHQPRRESARVDDTNMSLLSVVAHDTLTSPVRGRGWYGGIVDPPRPPVSSTAIPSPLTHFPGVAERRASFSLGGVNQVPL